MKYLKRTGPRWWRGGGGSVQSLHPKTEATHAPRNISPTSNASVSRDPQTHSPCPSSTVPPPLPHTPHLLPCPPDTPDSLPAPAPLVHLPTPAQAPTSSPLTQANRCQHLCTPMHTHALHPFSALHTCGAMHTCTHTHKMRTWHISKKDTQNVNSVSACKGQMRPPVPGGRPECSVCGRAQAPLLTALAGRGGVALQQHGAPWRQEAGGGCGSAQRRSRLLSGCRGALLPGAWLVNCLESGVTERAVRRMAPVNHML